MFLSLQMGQRVMLNALTKNEASNSTFAFLNHGKHLILQIANSSLASC
jgi:hypothetical protein